MAIEVDVNDNGTIDIEYGGTNASTASGARTNLGLGSAAELDAGNAEGEVVVVQAGQKLPVLDGSNLTNVQPIGGGVTSVNTEVGDVVLDADDISDGVNYAIITKVEQANIASNTLVISRIENVEQAAEDAEAAQLAAETSAAAALASETSAAASETAAGLSEASAATDAAQTALDVISTNADAASTAADAASTAADVVSTAADAVTTAQDVIDTNASQVAAADSETAAAISETNALTSENKAHDWAEEAEDVEVDPGEYSAHHWALKSQSYVGTHNTLGGIQGGAVDDYQHLTTSELVVVDEVDLQRHVVSEMQFNMQAAANRDKFGGSGFVEWGKHRDNSTTEVPINEGLTVKTTVSNILRLGRDDSHGEGTSKTAYPYVNINGGISKLGGDSSTIVQNIELPPAPIATNLVTNGTFDTDTSNWTPIAGATLSVVSGKLKVEGDTTDYPYCYQEFATEIGKTYKVSYDFEDQTGTGRFLVGTTYDGFDVYVGAYLNTSGTYVAEFTATTTTTFIRLANYTIADYTYSYFDNVSVIDLGKVERQDLVFLESWHEKVSDKDIAYPYGNTQSLLATDDSTGLTTIAGSFTGFETYSLFGNWQASSALIGLGLVWSTMTDANKKKFVSDPKNNVYLAEDGELIQVRYRVRVIEGLGTDYDITESTVYSQGENVTIQTNNFTLDSVDKGLYSSTDSDAIQIILVSRRNQGAYHPVFNPNGSGGFRNDAGTSTLEWYSPTVNISEPNSTYECFLNINQTAAPAVGKGAIINVQTYRPDGKYYDVIYEGDVLDLRNSAHKQDLTRTLEREFNKLVSGEVRGWEGQWNVVEQITFNPDNITYITEVVGGCTRVLELGLIIGDNYGAREYVDHNVRILVEGNSKYYECVAKINGTNSGVYLMPYYGDVTADFTSGNPYKIIIAATNNIECREMLQCDIIGDPANYPQEWIDNGVAGTPLLVGEEGEDLIPDGTSKTFKMSRKVKEALFYLYSTDGGVTWTAHNDSFLTGLEGASNSGTTTGFQTGSLTMIFYLTEASPFENADNAEVLLLNKMRAFGHNASDQGSAVCSNLINKIPTDNAVPNQINRVVDGYKVNIQDNSELNTSAGHEPVHDAVNLGTICPTVKILPYLTRENGKLFMQTLFKEMKYDDGVEYNDLTIVTSMAAYNALGTVSVGSLVKLNSTDFSAFNGRIFHFHESTDVSSASTANFDGSSNWAFSLIDGQLLYTVGGVVTESTFSLWDGNGWGDDNKFDVVDGVSTTTDDNGNIVLVGQKRLELPYFIGDGE